MFGDSLYPLPMVSFVKPNTLPIELGTLKSILVGIVRDMNYGFQFG